MGYIEYGGHELRYKQTSTHGKLLTITNHFGELLTFVTPDDLKSVDLDVEIILPYLSAFGVVNSTIEIALKGSGKVLVSGTWVGRDEGRGATAHIHHDVSINELKEIWAAGGIDFKMDVKYTKSNYPGSTYINVKPVLNKYDGTTERPPSPIGQSNIPDGGFQWAPGVGVIPG